MNKKIFYGLSFAFLLLGTASCGKSTTGKIANKWTIVSQNDEQTSENVDGSKSYSKTTYTETTVSKYSELMLTPGGTALTSEMSGTVTTNAIDIKKDGTWTWNQELIYNEDIGGGNVNKLAVTIIQSGNWNFIKKSKGEDFKKNERISLETLEINRSTVQTVNGGLAGYDSDKITYAPGESIVVYTIVESKNKKLELKSEANAQGVSNGNSSSTKMTQTIVLEEK